MMVDQPFKQPRLQSSQQHFSNIPRADIPRSVFNRDHLYKTTFNAGYLIPILVDEALPGDSFKCKVTTFARLATPLKPFMDNLYADIHFFAVPYRLVWDNFQKFMGEQRNPGDSTDYLIPQFSAFTPAQLSLSDYMGCPPGKTYTFNSLWHRAYNLIWNEWYRDENLQNSVTVDVGDGPDNPANYTLLRRGERKDYFTGALPWPQKGPSVDIPLGGVAPVLGFGKLNSSYGATNQNVYESNGAQRVFAEGEWIGYSSGANNQFLVERQSVGGVGYPDLRVDLADVTGVTINALREAIQIQRMFERDARGGTRYIEINKSHFGVTSPDARLQRPEYIGGGTTMINTSPVPQTSASDGSDTPQGTLAAMGTFSHHGVGFNKSFVEHTLVIGLLSVRAELTYQQGLNRMFSRRTRFDMYWPVFSHLGEQAILNKEIFLQGSDDPVADAAVFGYQERYAEYRYKPSQITGLLRSDATGSIDYWHLAKDFATLPALSAAFIQVDPPIARVIAVPSEPHFILDALFDYKTARPMPTYSVPGLMDHF